MSVGRGRFIVDRVTSQSSFPAPVAHRAAPISVSSSPRPHVYECSDSYSGALVHWYLRVFNSPVERQARRQ